MQSTLVHRVEFKRNTAVGVTDQVALRCAGDLPVIPHYHKALGTGPVCPEYVL